MKLSNLGRCWGLVYGLALAAMLAAGCSSGSNYAEVPGLPAAQTGSLSASTAGAHTPAVREASEIDRISVGDNLLIVFSDLPVKVEPIEERVREDGTITLIQNQSFDAKDKMRGELEKEIHKRYVPAYFRTMTVSVTPQRNTQFYYVDGEVKQPDRQIWLARLTVLKAIASAKGFTDFARKKAVVLTRVDGRKYTVNCVKAQTDPKLDLEVYPGDKIYVPRRNPLY